MSPFRRFDPNVLCSTGYVPYPLPLLLQNLLSLAMLLVNRSVPQGKVSTSHGPSRAPESDKKPEIKKFLALPEINPGPHLENGKAHNFTSEVVNNSMKLKHIL
ncbi:jg5289 [Pararge aegeria aegeria]|uniref:Jg5289 protein n=1 Tax=Pararge aegeria aegeria TaxID=348720 RepID=A0A8S4RCT3_9NEOP|nr:jg5289 [Pararge aegeria aegeria]